MARKKQNSSISLPHGRKRTISPGFFTDSALLSLSPLHRIFFEGLFVFADRSGRLLYRPIDLKIRILPMDHFDPVQGLADLEVKGLVRIYQSGPLKVIALKERSWREVQRLHPDEPESSLPAPPAADEVWSNSRVLAPKIISVIGNAAEAPIPVHGNASVDPIPGSGSSGSSCLRDPRDPRAYVDLSTTTTSDRAQEHVRAPPRLVVVAKNLTADDLAPADRERWEHVQHARQRFSLNAETVVPDGFPQFCAELVEACVDPPRFDHVLALYLRDQHFADRLWPTAVLIAPKVWGSRLPEPPREAAR